MITTKDIKLATHNFQLQYFTNQAIGATINEENCENLIEVIYAPFPTVPKAAVCGILKQREHQILKQIAVVINENKKFYSQFYISLKLVRTDYIFEDNKNAAGNVIKASSFLKITLKHINN